MTRASEITPLNLRCLLITAKLDLGRALMFQRQSVTAVVVFLAGCATASEPPVQQAIVPEPVQWTTYSVEPSPSVGERPKRSIGDQGAAVPATESSNAVRPNSANSQSIPDDNAIIRHVLAESRARYQGNCACPDDRDRAGRRCGGRSAYSRPRGYSPLCYPRDVTPEMIERARQELML